MVKVEIEVVKPNLYVRDFKDDDKSHLLYSLETADYVVKSARDINEVVKTHIDKKGLRVQEPTFKAMKYEKSSEGLTTFSVSLDEYLNIFYERESINGVGTKGGSLFGVYYYVYAFSYENVDELTRLDNIKQFLTEPDRKFDEKERDEPLVYNRKSSLENMRKIFEELEQKIPNQTASLSIFPAQYSGAKNSWVISRNPD